MNTTDKGGLARLQAEWRALHKDLCEPACGFATCADALTPFIQERADLIAALEAAKDVMFLMLSKSTELRGQQEAVRKALPLAVAALRGRV